MQPKAKYEDATEIQDYRSEVSLNWECAGMAFNSRTLGYSPHRSWVQ